MISKKNLDIIHAEAIGKYPMEACGVLLKKGKKCVAVACRNASPEPANHLTIDPMEYSRLCDTGAVVGIWHTHPEQSAEASIADRVGCEDSELPWFILSLHKRGDEYVFSDPVTIQPEGTELPYLERPYVTGVLDCYSIVRDYYKREFGITINDYLRVEADGRMGYSFFVDRYEQEGFVRLVNREPQIGDVFIIQTGTTNNHLAIYVGNDQILHHCHGRLSRRDVYGGGFWQHHTTYHLRHKTKC